MNRTVLLFITFCCMANKQNHKPHNHPKSNSGVCDKQTDTNSAGTKFLDYTKRTNNLYCSMFNTAACELSFIELINLNIRIGKDIITFRWSKIFPALLLNIITRSMHKYPDIITYQDAYMHNIQDAYMRNIEFNSQTMDIKRFLEQSLFAMLMFAVRFNIIESKLAAKDIYLRAGIQARAFTSCLPHAQGALISKHSIGFGIYTTMKSEYVDMILTFNPIHMHVKESKIKQFQDFWKIDYARTDEKYQMIAFIPATSLGIRIKTTKWIYVDTFIDIVKYGTDPLCMTVSFTSADYLNKDL